MFMASKNCWPALHRHHMSRSLVFVVLFWVVFETPVLTEFAGTTVWVLLDIDARVFLEAVSLPIFEDELGALLNTVVVRRTCQFVVDYQG
ncbi:hypothetical protein BDZ94DRAFT_27205 [Collybia nuda]|uniref:Uncharacterized protein n=1 Tax=Collybia nuda TaxID=64659 RepID=A0A9P5YI90_9AGAR|nr:hypothetical protein BDZ94DRAFT_27205 [Collybia nuda]